jgi:ribosome recycling factor
MNLPILTSNVQAAAIKTSFLVEVKWPGKTASFRWPTMKQAKKCASDFKGANVTIRTVRGYMSFEGWVCVDGK